MEMMGTVRRVEIMQPIVTALMRARITVGESRFRVGEGRMAAER